MNTATKNAPKDTVGKTASLKGDATHISNLSGQADDKVAAMAAGGNEIGTVDDTGRAQLSGTTAAPAAPAYHDGSAQIKDANRDYSEPVIPEGMKNRDLQLVRQLHAAAHGEPEVVAVVENVNVDGASVEVTNYKSALLEWLRGR